MGVSYLFDSNVIIQYVGNLYPQSVLENLDKVVDKQFTISVISKIEVLGFAGSEREMTLLNNFVNQASIIPLTEGIVDRVIELRKHYKIKIPDAIIGATALQFGHVLVTGNISDFSKIQGLVCINP